MTCLIGVGSPGCSGMTVVCGVPETRILSPSLKPLLETTLAVYVASWVASGTAIWERVPLIIVAMYWLSGPYGLVYGLGPPGLGPAPRPLALSTSSSLPLLETSRAVGYQAVGIRPWTLSSPCLAPREMTATSLFAALAT